MSQHSRLARIRFSTMGCPAELAVYANSKAAALSAFRIAQHETRRLDCKYSHYRADSFLAHLQIAASEDAGVIVDAETASLLEFAACLFRHSDRRFDVTAGLLTRLWQRSPRPPSGQDIRRALLHTGWNKLGWNGSRLKLPAGMELDLGGIVKEYAADRVALLLRRAGFHSGYIDLGGDLHILGPHPGGEPWKVGIRHPRQPGAMACTEISSGGLASSGDYERYRMINGERYSHIIDARNGWPVRGLASVSVHAPSCLVAGAVSTQAMLLEMEAALQLLDDSGLRWLAYQAERPQTVAFLSASGFPANQCGAGILAGSPSG